jgi:hypothetical protein
MLVTVPVPIRTVCEKIQLLWNLKCIGNHMREFIFKCRNYYQPLNNRVNAFDRTVDPRCCFCRIRDPATTTRESFYHLFLQCATTQGILNALYEFLISVEDNENEKLNIYWYGNKTDASVECKLLLLMLWETFRYVIFQYKLKRTIPNYPSVQRQVFFSLKTTILTNVNFRLLLNTDPALARLRQALG